MYTHLQELLDEINNLKADLHNSDMRINELILRIELLERKLLAVD